MSSSADDLRGSASEPGAAVAPGTPSPLDRLPGEDVPGDTAIAGDASTDPSVAPPGTPSWFDASAFANPSFDAAAYVDDMSAYVSMDALREELESYQRHLRRLLVDAVNEDYDVFLSLGEGLVDVRKVVEDDMEGPIAAFKRDVTDTRAEIVALLNDLREKLRRRAECAERRATLELMLDANNVASKVERLLDQLDSGDDENEASDDEAKEKENGGGAGWTWKGPDEKEAKEKDDDDASDVDSDDDSADAAFESEIAAAAAAEVFSVAETSVAGLDALRPGVAADGPSAAALALADDVSRADASSTPASASASAKTSRASDLRERCRLLERVAGEANRSRFFQKIGDEKNLAFVKGLRSRVEKSEERLADAVAKATSLACAARDAVSVARCFSAYVALGRVSEAERAIRETRVAPAVKEALRTSNEGSTGSATETESGGASNGASNDATAASRFGALLKKCVAAALRSVDVELAVTCPDWGLGKDEESSGVTTSAANLDARVCVLGASVLAEIDDQISSLAPSAYTPGAPEAFFQNHLAACAAIDVLEKNLPPTKAALALFRDSEPVRVFFKRWNVAAYFALRRREIVARLEADLEEDRLTRAVGAPGSAGAAFATAAAAGTYEALEKCFDTERVFLPRATDKFVKLAAQILARFGGWVAAGAKAERPSRSPPEADLKSAKSGDESGDVSSVSGSAEPPPVASWGATASDEDLLQLREDVVVLVARVENELAPRVENTLRRTLGDAAAAAAREVLVCGAETLVDSDAEAADVSSLTSSESSSPSERILSATQLLDERLVSDVVKRCATALGQLKGVTATFRMTNKPMPTKPSHFFSGVVDPLRRFAESDATARASEKTRRAIVDAAVAGVCAAYAAAAADLTVSVRKTEASLNRLKDRKGTREPSSGGVAKESGEASDGPTDAQKICRQVRLDAEAFGRAVAKLGFDTGKSDAFGKLWEVCGEGEPFVA